MSGRTVRMGALALGLACAAGADAAATASPSKVTGVVNLNKASPAELALLPGVKEKAVAKILAHREKHPFTRVEDLVNVKGFNKRKYEQIKPHLSVGGDTTIKKAVKQVKKRAAPKKQTQNP